MSGRVVKTKYDVGENVWICAETKKFGLVPIMVEVHDINVRINRGIYGCAEPAEINYCFEGVGDLVWVTEDRVYESFEEAEE